ncbi:sensor domain-containing diguanylate cyclase [Oceanospirillum sanctuarii]|uniref:sensor domain-containing diguanylate cyclase n=1 Tax=Oceanospirillum sanctuarii TaxID=1434821 RepID=UPI001C3E48FA|nr:sensor domain-containing diguanylate cyclase [Oceanospirillum sanctuarii]
MEPSQTEHLLPLSDTGTSGTETRNARTESADAEPESAGAEPAGHDYLTLNRLILLLAFSAAMLTLLNSFYASYQVQKKQLIQHELNSNFAYATKLASTTNNFLKAAQQQLAFAAGEIQGQIHDSALLLHHADRLRLQTDSFNSVVIADHTGQVLATSPNTLEIIGERLKSDGAREALLQKKALISAPYISATGRLLVFISHPLFDAQGNYLGYIGGSLYLKERSILNDLLATHYYKDGSYIYVVDANHRLIYHPDQSRVGEVVEGNQVISRVLEGNDGALRITNSKNIEMLAGFAPIGIAHWGVIAQRPVEATLASLNSLMAEVFYRSLPMAAVTFLTIWLLSRLIARPLKQLAETARTMDQPNTYNRLTQIRSWYFESSELKRAMLKGFSLLQQQIGQLRHAASTDPLTGAYNRRSLDLCLSRFEQEGKFFSVLAVDIDHFKQVNDRFGHEAGDKALVSLCQKMSELSREQDIVARTGGEEFVLVLPNTPKEHALAMAERLRSSVAEMMLEQIGTIRISVGVASFHQNSHTPKQVLKQADQALYQAKRHGRNRCVLYQEAYLAQTCGQTASSSAASQKVPEEA